MQRKHASAFRHVRPSTICLVVSHAVGAPSANALAMPDQAEPVPRYRTAYGIRSSRKDAAGQFNHLLSGGNLLFHALKPVVSLNGIVGIGRPLLCRHHRREQRHTQPRLSCSLGYITTVQRTGH